MAGNTGIGLVIKFDTAGNIVWKTYLPDSGAIKTIIAFDDTSYLCAGFSISGGTADVLLARLNWDGSVLWKQYFGGSRSDYGVDIVKTTDGGFAVLGTTYATDGQVTGAAPLSNYETNAWVFKIDPAGNLLWQKSLDYLDSTFSDEGKRILVANDDQLMVFTFPATYLIEQASGNTSFFNYSYNGMPGMIAPTAATVCKAYNDGAYLFAYDNSPAVMLAGVKKIAPGGTLLSIDTIGYSQNMQIGTGLHGMIPLPGDEYISAGYIVGRDMIGDGDPGFIDAYIYNSGNKQVTSFGGDYNDHFSSVKLLPGGDAFIAVGYSNGHYSSISGGSIQYTSDIWVVKMAGAVVAHTWTGAVSSAWEDPQNWNSNTVPGMNAAVIIPAAVVNFPEISSDANCYSIRVDPSATLLIKTGIKLNVNGKNN